MRAIPVFLALTLPRYTKIPRIDEIGHNLIDVEKSLNRTNVDVSFLFKLLRYRFSTATSQRQQLIVIVRS